MIQGCGKFYAPEPTSAKARDICILTIQEENQGSVKDKNAKEYIQLTLSVRHPAQGNKRAAPTHHAAHRHRLTSTVTIKVRTNS